MREGSCSAALISLWDGLPVILLTMIVFTVQGARGRNEGRRRKASRAAGPILALAAFPFWMFAAFAVANRMGWA